MSKNKQPLLKLRLDQTSLGSTFQAINSRLDKHEEMILELQNRIFNIPTHEELNKFKDSLLNDVDAKNKKISEKIDQIEEKFMNQMQELEDSFSERLLENSNMLNLSIRRQFEQIKQKLPGNEDKSVDIEKKMRNLERYILKVEKNGQITHDCLQQVVSAINLIDSNIISKNDDDESISNDDNNLNNNINNDNKPNGTNDDVHNGNGNDSSHQSQNENNSKCNSNNQNENVKINNSSNSVNKDESITLDENIYYKLKEPIISVNDNFSSLSKEIKLLKAKVEEQQILNEKRPQQIIQIAQEPNQTTTNEFDITSIHPYPPVAAHWRDPPELPAIHPFLNIGEVVDYVYRIVPRLQAYLTAMQAKIVENAGEIANKAERTLIEKMFEKFQTVLSGLSKRVSELKEGYDKTPSRDEINSIVTGMIKMISQESQTSIGRLKCIACGREIPQVTGAMSEDEALNSLGPVTNSTVFHVHTPSNVGVRYGDAEHFDSEIVEAPLSIRPNKISAQAILPLNQNSKKPK